MQTEIDTFEQHFIAPRRASLLLSLLVFGAAMWCVLATLLPHDPYIRYQQLTSSDLFRSRWVYERIHYDKTPIDVAIIGTSRVEAAISPAILAQELTAKFGRTIHVANMAIPEEGRNLHYEFVKELLDAHPETRIILLSVSEQANTSHPAFKRLASVEDILKAPLLINHYYFLDAAILPYRQMSYFIQTQFPGWFGVSRTFRRDYMGTDFDPTYSFTLPNGILINRYGVGNPEKLAAGSTLRTQMLQDSLRRSSAWDRLNNPEEPVYSARTVELAKQHGAEVIFVHLPYYKNPPDTFDEETYRRLAPYLDARELSSDPHLYADTDHFNRYGTELVSKWLWRAISPYLGPLDEH